MKTLSTTFLSLVLKYILVFVIAFGVFFTPMCHYCMEVFFKDILMNYLALDEAAFKAIIVELYALGIVMVLVSTQLIGICTNVIKNNPFVPSTAKYLKTISILCFVMVVISFVKYIVFPALPCILVALTFIIIGMFSSVFSQLFKKAVEYKTENDLTI